MRVLRVLRDTPKGSFGILLSLFSEGLALSSLYRNCRTKPAKPKSEATR